MKPPDPLAHALDALYGAPLDEFSPMRKRLAAELEGAGEAAAARSVAEAPKPTRTAWALNQVARRRPELVKAMLDAWASASAAQKGGVAAAMRESARAYRESVAAVVKAAREVMAGEGMEANPIQQRRMGETLQAASGGDAEGRARLVAGRLEKDVEVGDPFAGLEGGEGGGRGGERERGRERERERERDREREVARARGRVEAAVKAAQREHAAAREAEERADRARGEAERARERARAADVELEQARRALEALEGEG